VAILCPQRNRQERITLIRNRTKTGGLMITLGILAGDYRGSVSRAPFDSLKPRENVESLVYTR
jgi:hypothetical protein